VPCKNSGSQSEGAWGRRRGGREDVPGCRGGHELSEGLGLSAVFGGEVRSTFMAVLDSNRTWLNWVTPITDILDMSPAPLRL
jgi:hypothetical protein